MKSAGVALLLAALALPRSGAQEFIPGRVDIPFNRYWDHAQIVTWLRRIEAAYPGLVRVDTIGRSLQGREMVVVTVNTPKTGSDRDKPAMWIDANVHGNEVQGAEVVLYSVWYLTKAYGVNAELTRILDEKSFYFLPSQNPDGRDFWFHAANTSSSSRGNQRPVDSDRDGLFDEDAPDDLDGDGSITSMWVEDPDGEWVRDEHDPNGFRRAREGEKGAWRRAGSEGIDNDGDGRINEDGPGGDDMNRDWPLDWQPPHVQSGAGPYPFSSPETRAIGEFLLDHANVAAVQSYHNAGGMILRGPGAAYLADTYPRSDVAVYDEIGKVGERLLPYYRYMIIHKDLYTVHGGFVNWTAEGLGIFSFTNELWNEQKVFQRDGQRQDPDGMLERDRLRFGAAFTPFKEYEHPTLGQVLIGGDNRWSSRVTPTWLLEEECHRNFAFTMFHADHMPVLEVTRTGVKRLRGDLYAVTVQIGNDRLIPTRSAIAQRGKIGTPDLLHCTPPTGGQVVAAGPCARFDDTAFDAVRHEPGRLRLDGGIGSKDKRCFRFLVRAPQGGEVSFRYQAEKAKDLEFRVPLAQ